MEFLSFLRTASTTTLLSILLSVPSYLRVGLVTTWNIVLYAVSLRRCIWLEGRVGNDGVFMNWIRHFRYAPANFVRPTTEEEIVDCVKQSRKLRLFGAGHSFNDGVVSEETLLSLDDYSGLVCKYLDKNQIAVKGGTRIRKVAKLLLDEGLAFKALPSHDAQSIGGILSTDVHGTGRIFGTKEENWGFVSESVVRLKLVDGKEEIHECEPSADLFKAAIGGVGAVGMITEVVVQGVPASTSNRRSKDGTYPSKRRATRKFSTSSWKRTCAATTTSASTSSPSRTGARSTRGTPRTTGDRSLETFGRT
jgi:FAD/FMN-containing dehydrogenase